MDDYGFHAVVCSYKGDRTTAHNDLADAVQKACETAGCTARKEKRGLIADSEMRPGDVSIFNWDSSGRTLCLDLTRECPMNKDNYHQAANQSGYTLNKAVTGNRAKYAGKINEKEIEFLPLAVEVFGRWSEGALEFFRMLAKRIAERQGTSYTREIHYLMQRLSVCLQRDNANMIIARVPGGRGRMDWGFGEI
jgi:hypothetical protein